MTTQKDRLEAAIRHIQTSADIDPWAMELAISALKAQMDGDTISRQAAIDALAENKEMINAVLDSLTLDYNTRRNQEQRRGQINEDIETIKELSSAQPEIKPIEYRDCANAMLKMWMDNVVTDGEYNRIMDKLNAHWGMKNE